MILGDLPRAQRESVSYLASQVARLAQGELAGFMSEVGLTRSHFTVLCALQEFGAMSQAELAGRTHVNRGHQVGFLDDLETHGSLARHADPRDRRRNVVRLTAPGERFVSSAMEAARASERHLLGSLEDGERDQLRELLSRVLNHAGRTR